MSSRRGNHLLAAVPAVLKRENPEAAIVMIGTNDTGPEEPPASFGPNLEELLQMIRDAHCIPILSTIIRDLAQKMNVPRVDCCAEILKRQPGQASKGGTILAEAAGGAR